MKVLVVVILCFFSLKVYSETTYPDYKYLDRMLIDFSKFLEGDGRSYCDGIFIHVANNGYFLAKKVIKTPIEFSPLPKGSTKSIESTIIYCINKNNLKLFEDICGDNKKSLLFKSKSKQIKCLKKVNKHQKKIRKKEDKVLEKCIKKADKMDNESAYKDMLYNCLRQNNY